MILKTILAALAILSLGLTLWQWLAARRFPLHRRIADKDFFPPVTLLKPLKGCDAEAFHCLASWLKQDYAGPVQTLFGVASPDDPVCEIVRSLIAARPRDDAQLVVCKEALGPNAKVSTLIQLGRHARHDVLIVSDADVRAPSDLLANVVAPLRDPGVGLVNCFYRLANPSTLAMQWEAIAINADFWSQVLQSRTLRPLDFALGAVMATTRKRLEAVGGFEALVDCLADDYQLGNRISVGGGRIELCPVVVECCESPKGWRAVWRHQLRWARTIRVCQPLPWFFSILSNATLWPLVWLLATLPSPEVTTSAITAPTAMVVTVTSYPLPTAAPVLLACLWVRILTTMQGQSRLTQGASHWFYFWLVPIKDLFHAVVWGLSFLGNRVEWSGQRYRVSRGGTLRRCG